MIRKCALLAVKEILRVLDTILAKVSCPNCTEVHLISFKATELHCVNCDCLTLVEGLDPEGAVRRNVVAWSKGNVRRRVGKKVTLAILRMQESLCAYCAGDLSSGVYHIDHIVPLSFGGSNHFDNLAVSCPRCNLLAGAKVFPSLTAKKIYILREILRGRS